MNNTSIGCNSFIDGLSAGIKLHLAYWFGTNAVIATVLNSMIILIFFIDRSLRKWNYYLILSLAVGDLLIGGILSPVTAIQLSLTNQNCLFDKIGKFLTACVASSVFTICAIAYNRYLQIKGISPDRLTKRQIFLWFVLPWLTPLFLVLFRFVGDKVFSCVVIAMLILSYVLLLVSYAIVLYASNKEFNRITTQSPEILARIKSNKKAIHFLILLIVVYILSSMGILVLRIMKLIIDLSHSANYLMRDYNGNSFLAIAILLFQANSSINPILYFWKIKKLRQAALRAFCVNRVEVS